MSRSESLALSLSLLLSVCLSLSVCLCVCLSLSFSLCLSPFQAPVCGARDRFGEYVYAYEPMPHPVQHTQGVIHFSSASSWPACQINTHVGIRLSTCTNIIFRCASIYKGVYVCVYVNVQREIKRKRAAFWLKSHLFCLLCLGKSHADN